MPRYFIDTDDNDKLVQDSVGHELPDAQAARKLALSNLPEMAHDKLPDGDRRTFTVRVRDDQGRVVYVAELKLTGEWLIPPSAA